MDQSIIGHGAEATGYGEVEPIDEDKLQSAFRAIALRNRVEQAYKSLHPNERTDAALAGLQYGASDHDVALSAFIMQADPKMLEDVRREYALQQAPLLANKNNRDNYMNGDAELLRRGELDAAARFERQFAQARSGEEPTLKTIPSGPSLKPSNQMSSVHNGLPNATDTSRIARVEAPSPVYRANSNGPVTHANPLGSPPVFTPKKPPEPPPQSAKPSTHKPAEGPLRGPNATLSEKKPDRIVNGNAPAFGGVKSALGGVTSKPANVATTGNGQVIKGNAPAFGSVKSAPGGVTPEQRPLNAHAVPLKPVVVSNTGNGPVVHGTSIAQKPIVPPNVIQNTGGGLATSFAQKPAIAAKVGDTAKGPQPPLPVSRTPNQVLAESALTKPQELSKVQQLAHQFNKRIV